MDLDGMKGDRYEIRRGRVWLDVGSVRFKQMWDRLRLVVDIDAEPAEWEFADAIENLAIEIAEVTESECLSPPEA